MRRVRIGTVAKALVLLAATFAAVLVVSGFVAGGGREQVAIVVGVAVMVLGVRNYRRGDRP